MKKALLIVNPCSGLKKINKYIDDIVTLYKENDIELTVLFTGKRKDATIFAKENAKDYDLLICAGGDGTFNEMIAGVLESKVNIPVGYIPCGSTNDFAVSLNLSKNIMKAAKDIIIGTPTPIDIGLFNNRPFTYVSSFGCFTSASYSAPQKVKNVVGHLAYILEGLKSLTSLKATNVTIKTDCNVYSYPLLFGTISNSKSIAGLLTLDSRYVDMSDGSFEMLLIKMPKNMIELLEIIVDLKTQKLEGSNFITFESSKSFEISNAKDVPWTLDGEYDEGADNIKITNLNKAINLIVKK